MIKTVSLILLSFVIALLSGEGAVRLFAPQDLTGSWLVDTGHGYRVNKSSGTARHQFGKRVVHYHFYPPHLRGAPLKQGPIRVLVLGDSFTFGLLLPWRETYVYRLQQVADEAFGKHRFQFINAATGGWGTADYLAYLEEFGEKIRPNIILVFTNTDDIGRSIRRNIYILKNKTGLQLKTNLKSPKKSLLASVKDHFIGYNWLLEHSQLLQLSRRVLMAIKLRHGQLNPPPLAHPPFIPQSTGMPYTEQYSVRYSRALFHRMKQWASQHHAVLLVTTPGFDLLRCHHHATKLVKCTGDELTDPTRYFYKHIHHIFRAEKIPYYNFSSKMMNAVKKGERIQIPAELHPNAHAAKLITRFLWPWLKLQFNKYCDHTGQCRLKINRSKPSLVIVLNFYMSSKNLFLQC